MAQALANRLVPQLRAILEKSDLSTVSAKAVRKQLVAQGEDAAAIKAARGEIDEQITAIYDELTANAPASPASSEDLPISGFPQSSQPEPLSRPKSKPKPTVKRERKPSPSPVDEEETDEQMAKRLQMELNGEGGRPRRAGAAPSKPVKKRKKVVSKARAGSGSDSEVEDVKKKKRGGGGGGAFNKELILSDALADLVGTARLSRPQVVKQIWAYVKERDLQDPNDKRYIRCDEKLNRVFHTDRLHMFTMNKILVDHVRNPDDVI
ncbi:hypothetical protein IAT38_007983 [Cryptococcus sp. DSM 104549]